MIYNETAVQPEGDLDALEWREVPDIDSLGAKVDQARAFRVSTRAELARVIEAANEEGVILRPVGALTSSKAFGAPPESWMKAQRKNGVWVVSFDKRGEFGEINVDMSREEVTVGAAVSLQEMEDAVREKSIIENGTARPRLANVMRITTMDALAVATALGSGGVSDAGESSISAMKGAHWMDGRGVVHNENYDPKDYFDSASSSFARVDHRRVGMEMSGRGAPFGIGLQSRFKLVEAPVETFTAVYPFFGTEASVRDQLAKFVTTMNLTADRLKLEQAPLQVAALEVMDLDAMNVAAEGLGRKPFSFSDDPCLIVIADFAQFDWWDEGSSALDDFEALCQANDLGLIPEDFQESIMSIRGAGKSDVTKFRLQGPEHMRAILKRRKLVNPSVGSESTDWAVDPRDPMLVKWYFDRFFQLQDLAKKKAHRRALYGHLLNRLDLHDREIFDDPNDLRSHLSRSIAFGHEVAVRQKEGQKVRVRGEKVELPYGRDLETIGKLREGPHRDSNVRLLKRVDPNGIFKDRAPERWGGRYDY